MDECVQNLEKTSSAFKTAIPDTVLRTIVSANSHS